MEVVNQYGDFDKKEIFNLSQGNGQLLKNQPDGLIIDIAKLIILSDKKADKNGEEKVHEIMHIITTDGQTYSTESPTVISTIIDAVEFMETHFLRFNLYRQQSKAGRTFMNVSLL